MEETSRRTELWWLIVVGAAGLVATNLSQIEVIDLPFRHLLKAKGVQADQAAVFFAIATLAWNLKPIAGLLSDAVPLFGSRRRNYLLLSAVGATALWALTALTATYTSLLLVVVAMNAMLVMGSTVIGGLLAEGTKRLHAGRQLAVLREATQTACALVAGPLGGALAGRSFRWTSLTGSVVSFVVVPAALAWREPPLEPPAQGIGREMAARLRATVGAKEVWIAAALLFFIAAIPSYASLLYYVQRDTLGFSDTLIGNLNLVAAVAELLGTFAYGYVARGRTLAFLLPLGIVCRSGASLIYLRYRSVRSAYVVDATAGFLNVLLRTARQQLVFAAAPKQAAATGVAFIWSFHNIALSVGDIVGAALKVRLGVTFASLVVLNAALTLLALVFIRFLPADLARRRVDAT